MGGGRLVLKIGGRWEVGGEIGGRWNLKNSVRLAHKKW